MLDGIRHDGWFLVLVSVVMCQELVERMVKVSGDKSDGILDSIDI